MTSDNGRWVDVDSLCDELMRYFGCPKCQTETPIRDGDAYTFCPRCGARMIGEPCTVCLGKKTILTENKGHDIYPIDCPHCYGKGIEPKGEVTNDQR
jgi:hypothetical protein